MEWIITLAVIKKVSYGISIYILICFLLTPCITNALETGYLTSKMSVRYDISQPYFELVGPDVEDTTIHVDRCIEFFDENRNDQFDYDTSGVIVDSPEFRSQRLLNKGDMTLSTRKTYREGDGTLDMRYIFTVGANDKIALHFFFEDNTVEWDIKISRWDDRKTSSSFCVLYEVNGIITQVKWPFHDTYSATIEIPLIETPEETQATPFQDFIDWWKRFLGLN